MTGFKLFARMLDDLVDQVSDDTERREPLRFPAIVNRNMQQISVEELLSELAYANYAYNRRRSPRVTPEQWAKVYGEKAGEMEERYQRETA